MGYFIFIISYATTTLESPKYISEKEFIEYIKTEVAREMKEPLREPFPIANLDSIMKDMLNAYLNMPKKKIWKRYPEEIVSILKPALESSKRYISYKVLKDKNGKTYFESVLLGKFYIEELLKYGKVLPPFICYSLADKQWDTYVVPLAFRDTVLKAVRFLIDSNKFSNLEFGMRGKPIDSYLANFDKADSIMNISLSPGEKIVSKKLFCHPPMYWGFLVERTNGKNVDSIIYLQSIDHKETCNLATDEHLDFLTHPGRKK